LFTADGAIRLVGADFSGQLNCRGAKLAGEDNDGYALLGDSMKVSGDVFLDQNFIVTGAIRLRSARVGGVLELWVRDSEYLSHVSGRRLEPCPGDVVVDVAVDHGQCLA
jgi:hypothetical protein